MIDVHTARWMRNFHPAPDAPVRLFCLPHAGGSASYYFPVSSALSPSIDVHAAQYPGRQDRRREPFVRTVDAMADELAAAIAPLADRPFALFGHSMGGALAFEVATRLAAAGHRSSDLFISSRRAACTVRAETTHLLPDREFIAELDGLSGTDGRVWGDEDLLGMVLPALRNDIEAIEKYRWTSGATTDADIHALLGRGDAKCTRAEIERWAEHTTGRYDLREYDGGHFYLTAHARTVITLIEDTLLGEPQAARAA